MISFTPSDEQQLVIDTVRRFASEQLRPLAHDADELRSTPPEVLTRGWELGLFHSAIPEAHGGIADAQAALTGALAIEELAAGDAVLGWHVLLPATFAVPLAHAGSAAQRERWLAPLLEGDYTPLSAALIEPAWDFDPTAPRTVAIADGEEYVLDGLKGYVARAADAAALLVYARLADSLAAFVVPRDSAGVTVLAREQHMGLRALPTYQVRFEGVRLPADARLPGAVAPLLDRSRVALAASAVGVARGAYEYARAYALQREAFGRPIAQNQSIAFMLAEMAIEIDATRLLAWEAAWRLDRGLPATREAALAAQYADEMVLTVTDRAVQILGGHGYIREYPVERWLREARGFPTFLGLAIV
ncbi:MAG: acyl-CoA dehydrogenase family protein [Chloroflexi bacterium]|nr:acyl-CoA dehydrogenase family protein [Chloroflexota bacterium]